MRWGQRAVIAAAATVMAFSGLTGCSSPTRCLPQPLTASATVVERGSTVKVSSPKASCDLGYKAGHTYAITIASEGSQSSGKPTPGPQTTPATVTVNVDGSFATTVPVPVNFPIGPAFIVVTGSRLDRCEDTGSCAGYAIGISVK